MSDRHPPRYEDQTPALRSCQQELNQAVVEGDMARRERDRFEAELADVRADRDRLQIALDLANHVERHSRQQRALAEADLSTVRAERDRLRQELDRLNDARSTDYENAWLS